MGFKITECRTLNVVHHIGVETDEHDHHRSRVHAETKRCANRSAVSSGQTAAHHQHGDEVGEIARAVVVLQHSMKDRERLKADVADIEEIRVQRLTMENAARECQTALRQRLFSLSDITETFETRGHKLSGLAGLAEGEADEARLVAVRALTERERGDDNGGDGTAGAPTAPAQELTGSIDRLSETISLLSTDTKGLLDTVRMMNSEMGSLNRVMIDFTHTITRSELEGANRLEWQDKDRLSA